MSKAAQTLYSLIFFFKNPWDRRRKLTTLALLIGQPIFIASLLVTGSIWGSRQLGWLQLSEMTSLDYMVSLENQDYIDNRLLIVGIDEVDIQNHPWPIPDQILANLLEELQQYQPRIIGLDLYREKRYPPGLEAFDVQLQQSNVIAIEELPVGDVIGVGPPPNVPKARVGYNNMFDDIDGVLRRQFIFTKYQGGQYSFALRVVLDYLNLSVEPIPGILEIGSKSFPRLEPDSGGYQFSDTSITAGYQVLLKYPSAQIAPEITLRDVLAGKLTPDQVKDKIVLIGNTAPSAKDFFRTPYNLTQDDLMAGVMIHAQAISHLLRVIEDEEPLIWFWSQPLEGLWIWGWAFMGSLLAWKLKHPVSVGIISLIGLGGLFGICYLAFSLYYGWIPFVPAALTFILAGASITVYKVFYNAFHDSLTGLPNRALFARQLQWQITPKHLKNNNFAVLCLGLDRFKIINETVGQTGGDAMLQTIVKRLKGCLRPTDKIARVGGDEFAILLKYKGSEETVISIVKRLQKQLKRPFYVNGEDIFPTISFGISIHKPEVDQEPIELLQNAHTAMDRAKVLGKDRYELFAAQMRDQVISRFELERDLRQGIKNKEFVLYYQPIVNLKTGKIDGFEALVRWQHYERGFVSPGAFIPVAEETGLIIPLGQWILQEACLQMHQLHQEFDLDNSLMISVNLSIKQFAQADLLEQVEQILNKTQLNPHSLKLEVTESMVIDDVEDAIVLLNRLKSLGIRLSMDDFGTGYSSLSYLHRFPMSTLKVDRSFVSRMEETGNENAIVRTIVILGHNLGMDVIAEGVETAEQLAQLRELNCEYGQGYFFAKPLPIHDVKALLAKDPRW